MHGMYNIKSDNVRFNLSGRCGLFTKTEAGREVITWDIWLAFCVHFHLGEKTPESISSKPIQNL